MILLNKNHFLSLTCALLVSGATVVPCTPDSPEVELFRTEFCDALHMYAGRQITDVIKKHRTSLCAVDINVALLIAQGYILGQLTLKKHLLGTWAITPSKQKDAMIQEVKDLECTMANLRAYTKIPDIFKSLKEQAN